MRVPHTRSGLVALVTIALCALTACSSVDDVARAAGRYADNADDLGKTKWVPEDYVVPPPSLQPTREAVVAAAEQVARPVADVPEDDFWPIVKGVCEGVDFVGALGSPEDAVEYAITRTSTAASYRLQAQGLAENLMAARSSTDQALILGQAALCQAASQQA
jgi:hypothetical protein